MAFTTETKTEVIMVKMISTVNQILLVHCFLMMMFADIFRTESEADYIYQEGDDDERTLMDRADSVSSLLPALSMLTMGFLVVTGGRRFLDVLRHY